MEINGKLARRIKRQVKGKVHDFFVIYPIGLEEIGLVELKRAGISEIKGVEPGGISFAAKVEDMVRATLFCKGAVRFLMRLAHFKAENFVIFHKRMKENIAWELYLPDDDMPQFSISTARSRLQHTGAIKERAEKALKERFLLCPCMEKKLKNQKQTIYIRFINDRCTVSLDCSGEPLYQRGYKRYISEAPLRENIASLLLQQFALDSYSVLYDPMCGCGTFPIEAALLLGRGKLAGLRCYPFQEWPSYSEAAFCYLQKKQKEMEGKQGSICIVGSDIKIKNIEAAQKNSQIVGMKAGTEKQIGQEVCDLYWKQLDFFKSDRNMFPMEGKMLMMLNLPYGKRVEIKSKQFFKRVGEKLKMSFPNTDVLLITGSEEAEKALHLHYEKKLLFNNGGIMVGALFLSIK